jgi:hypothetical protein
MPVTAFWYGSHIGARASYSYGLQEEVKLLPVYPYPKKTRYELTKIEILPLGILNYCFS